MFVTIYAYIFINNKYVYINSSFLPHELSLKQRKYKEANNEEISLEISQVISEISL